MRLHGVSDANREHHDVGETLHQITALPLLQMRLVVDVEHELRSRNDIVAHSGWKCSVCRFLGHCKALL